MATFKVARITAQYPLQAPKNQGPAGERFFGRVPGGAELPANTSDLRLAAITTVFNSGRDCFYDDRNKVFSTDPSDHWGEYEPVSGFVTDWDVRIPTSGDCEIRVLIQGEGETQSGHAAILRVTDDQLLIALAVASSINCYYDDGALRTFQVASERNLDGRSSS